MGKNDHMPVPDPVRRSRWKRWLARVLGCREGMTITVPHGATLIMPVGATVDTVNVINGSVRMGTEADIPLPWGENGPAPTHRRPKPPPAPPP